MPTYLTYFFGSFSAINIDGDPVSTSSQTIASTSTSLTPNSTTKMSTTATQDNHYPPSLLSAWRSPRLLYRAIEDTPTDRLTLHTFIDADPVAIAMSSLRPLSPQPITFGQRLYENAHLLHIRAFICLPPTEEEISQWEAAIAEKAEKSTLGVLDVEKLKMEFPKPGPKPIGVVTLCPPMGLEEQGHHRNAMIGVGIATEWRGKGYGGEAVDWVLDWGFGRLGLHRIWLAAFEFNERACRLYRKLGFVEEGRDRESVLFERRWWDLVRFGMLEGEWEQLREKRKKSEDGEGGKMEE
ncbi:acyl-CoA N-acyltransferase [Sordaria brevicollis]|uniref:Acyl-CoA N-acyltransferase n=1 Tax=Sordaria brevicollis TaxID=83679 RepID=A0AAE0PMR5_SORBR|nr:acyl-CoA N-acyltransferase [Sordaria brevicollis]